MSGAFGGCCFCAEDAAGESDAYACVAAEDIMPATVLSTSACTENPSSLYGYLVGSMCQNSEPPACDDTGEFGGRDT